MMVSPPEAMLWVVKMVILMVWVALTSGLDGTVLVMILVVTVWSSQINNKTISYARL